MARFQHHARITTNGTTTLYGSSCRVKRIVLECSNAGSSWTLKIQDRASPAGILAASKTQTADTSGLPTQIDLGDDGIIMDNGIDVVTAGTTPGVVDVWVVYGLPTAPATV